MTTTTTARHADHMILQVRHFQRQLNHQRGPAGVAPRAIHLAHKLNDPRDAAAVTDIGQQGESVLQ